MGSKTKNLLGNLTRSRELENQHKPTGSTSDKPKEQSKNSGINGEASNEGEKPSIVEKKTTGENISPVEIPAKPVETPLKSVETVLEKKISNISIRISDPEMNFIDSLVRYKRMSGDIKFTKKEALSEAILLLKDKYPDL